MTWVLVFDSIDKRALVGSVYDTAMFDFLSFLSFPISELYRMSGSNEANR